MKKKKKALRRQKAYEETTNGGGGRGEDEMKMEVSSNDVRNSLVWIDPSRDFECTSWKARLHLFQRVGGRKGCICMLSICDSRSLEKVDRSLGRLSF